jgi:hypothetical protein
MTNLLSRCLLAASAIILALGSIVHAASFSKAALTIDSSNLPVFYTNVFKAFWLMDSTTLILVGIAFGLTAAKPFVATRPVIILLALIPASAAVLLYTFIGRFIAADLVLFLAVAMAILAALLSKRTPD